MGVSFRNYLTLLSISSSRWKLTDSPIGFASHAQGKDRRERKATNRLFDASNNLFQEFSGIMGRKRVVGSTETLFDASKKVSVRFGKNRTEITFLRSIRVNFLN